MLLKADLHIHSCLSPCGSLQMSPSAIVLEAKKKGLDGIALTDHNCARHAPLFARLCELNGLAWLAGMEITTLEEAHVLALFDSVDSCMAFDKLVFEHLPDIPNRPCKWGDQVVVNEREEIEEEVQKYLGSATDIPLDRLITLVHDCNGLAIPSHVDKPVFSVVSQLGFLPLLPYDAVEVSIYNDRQKLSEKFGDYHFITSSDSHFLETIGRVYTEFSLPERSLSCDSVRKCLLRNEYRMVKNDRPQETS